MVDIIGGCNTYTNNRKLIESAIAEDISDTIRLDCLNGFSMSQRLILIYLDTLDIKCLSIINNLRYEYMMGRLSDLVVRRINEHISNEAVELNENRAFEIKMRAMQHTFENRARGTTVCSFRNINDSSVGYHLNGGTRLNKDAFIMTQNGERKVQLSFGDIQKILNLDAEDSEGIPCNIGIRKERVFEAILNSIGMGSEIRNIVFTLNDMRFAHMKLPYRVRFKMLEETVTEG